MKKTLSALVVLLALGAAGGAVYLFEKPGRAASATAAMGCLPPDTLLLLALPDLPQTEAEWKTTDLYKIWLEPDVQAFLAKPLSRLPATTDGTDTLARLDKLEPRNLFVALTALDEQTNRPHLIAGFQFKGDHADVDALLASPKEQMRRRYPAGKADLINYQGHPMETFDAGDGNSVASVYLNDWYLVGNDLALLKSTVDRLEHRAPAADAPALDKDADFQTVLAKLPSDYATLIFARAQPFVSRVLALSTAGGQTVDAEQRAEAEKVRAIGATTRIENGKLRDTFYVLSPGHKPLPAPLAMSALPLTSMDTLFFATGVYAFPDHLNLPPDTSNVPGADGLAALRGLGAMLEAHGLKLADLRAAFGSEVGLQLDWPASSAQPKVLASLDVRDPAAAGKFAANLTRTLNAEAGWQVAQADGLTFYTFTSPGVSFVSPTLTLTGKHLILGLNPPEVHDAAKRETTSVPNFTTSESYKNAATLVGKPNVMFSYLDAGTFFERTYGTLKPLAMLGAAFLLPQAGDYVDLGKLPAGESISKHLSPSIFSETSDEQGVLSESVGSFTYGEAAFVFAGASAAVAIPMLEKQYGAFPAVPAPAASPVPSPAQSGKDE